MLVRYTVKSQIENGQQSNLDAASYGNDRALCLQTSSGAGGLDLNCLLTRLPLSPDCELPEGAAPSDLTR